MPSCPHSLAALDPGAACSACGAPELTPRRLSERIGLFAAVNAAVLVTLMIMVPLLPGLAEALLRPVSVGFASTVAGLLEKLGNYYLLAPILGTGGALFSLWCSKRWAKEGVRLIGPGLFQNEEEARAYDLVERIAREAGLAKMPEVGVYNALSHMNAFATGPRRDDALVALSMALVDRLDEEALSAVIAHEVAHIVNGDMLMLTLIQAVINTVVLFVTWPLRVIQWLAFFDDRVGQAAFAILTLCRMVAIFLLAAAAALVVNWFSRQREYRADAGAARLVGPGAMIKALQSLAADDEVPQKAAPASAAFGVRGIGAIWGWFSTHPTIERRIARLAQLEASGPPAHELGSPVSEDVRA